MFLANPEKTDRDTQTIEQSRKFLQLCNAGSIRNVVRNGFVERGFHLVRVAADRLVSALAIGQPLDNEYLFIPTSDPDKTWTPFLEIPTAWSLAWSTSTRNSNRN
jgi:hypothetical protein